MEPRSCIPATTPSEWPVKPASCTPPDDSVELKRSLTCGITTIDVNSAVPDAIQFNTWKELLDATAQGLHGAASFKPSDACYRSAETLLLRKAQ